MENKLLVSVVASFIQDYEAEALAISQRVFASKRFIKSKLDVWAAERLSPVIDDMFKEGVKASNLVVKQEVANLAANYKLPIKYNKELLSTLQGDSVFTGFYDKSYKSLYKKREIDKLKRVILTGKYGGLSSADMAKEIRKTINITKKGALLLARSETTRLESAANMIYLNESKVNKEYDLVWVHNSNYDRHEHMTGGIANDDGLFHDSKSGNMIPPPPYIYSPWNCLCSTKFVKKV